MQLNMFVCLFFFKSCPQQLAASKRKKERKKDLEEDL
jgi:hypothetical protein